MKKYVKPELFYEHYELSQHIAECAWDMVNYTRKEICYAEPDPLKNPFGFTGPDGVTFVYRLFTSEPLCTLDSDSFEDYCYQGGAPYANVFMS